MQLCARLGIKLLNITAGSPYYCPHIQRPAAYPPSDGYQPPHDPLIEVARQIDAVRQVKMKAPPGMVIVGSAYSYLQEFLPNVAQAVVREGWADMIGLGRMILSYPTLPSDALERGALTAKSICRTFSDCTTAPRNGMISGCYPLDKFYAAKPEAEKSQGAEESVRHVTAAPAPPPPMRLSRWAIAGLAIAILLVIVVRLRLLQTPLERDEGEYAYAGQLILEGIAPYKLAYNMKLPGTYARYAAIIAAFGETPAGIHFGFLLVVLGTLALLFFVTRRLLDSSHAVVACICYALLSMCPGVLGLERDTQRISSCCRHWGGCCCY